jgi:hypothetical protein
LQCRDETDEHQSHDDRDDATDPLQQKLIGDQGRRHAEHRDGAEQEDRGESGDEQQRRAGDPQSRPGPHRGVTRDIVGRPDHRGQV